MKRLLLLPLVLLACISSPRVQAQVWNEVRIMHVDTTNFPSIGVRVRAFCAGQQSTNINPVTIKVYEDGVLRSISGPLTCPSTTVPASVALALDRSGSVAGTALYRIQLGAWRFVELLQSHSTGDDEAALITFGDDVTLHIGMTTNINDLFEQINKIYPYGVTTMYDALIVALNEVANNGSNPIKAVVVMSDGGDNNSLNDRAAVIALAKQLGIPIFSIGLAYIDNQNELLDMKALADSTGGVFLRIEHPDDIVQAFNAMMSLVTGGANDCEFQYQSICRDGTRRELTVIAEACGLADTVTVHYTAPLDPNLPVYKVTFDSTYAYERGDMLVPVSIEADIPGTVDWIEFKVLERPPLTFLNLVYAGYLADQGTVSQKIDGDSLIVRIDGPLILSAGKQTLMKIRYGTPPIGKDTTFWYPVWWLDMDSPDCVQYDAENHMVDILKRPGLDVICGDSMFVDWDESTGSFINDVVNLGVGIQNNSPLAATNTWARIKVPPGMELLSPSDSILLPTNPLLPGQTAFAEFQLRVLPTDTTMMYRVCIEVQPDSGRITECCKIIIVERARTNLQVECSMPSRIEWIDSLQRYEPEVFAVTVRMRNASDLEARDVPAWIHVPPGFAVDSTTPVNTTMAPARIGRADTGTVTWLIRPLERPTTDLLRFCIKAAAGKDTVVCCQDIYITASPVRVRMACTDTRVLVYDDGTGKYDPEMMLIVTKVTNTSQLPMSSTRGHITLPPFLDLDTGEFSSKDFPNSAVILPGDSAEIKWVVVTTGPPVSPAEICVNVTAENFPGSQCCTQIDVETVNAIPTLSCSLDAPDTIRYSAGAYVPNPFTLDLTVRNTGGNPAIDVYAALLQGEDLSIDPSDQALKLLTDSLAAGMDVDGSFRVRVTDRTVGRFDTIRVTVYASNGGAVVCEKIIWIEPVRGPVLELSCDGPDSLVFSDALNTYQPEPFMIELVATNVGTADADSVVAEFLPPPDIILATGEQAAKLLTPARLAVNQSGVASWLLKAVPRSVDRYDTIWVQVKARGKSLQQTEPCPIVIFIPAAREAALELDCSVIREALVDDTVIVAAELTNGGTATVYDVAVTVQFPSKLTLNPAAQPLVLRADSIQPGEALRLFPWRFLIERGAVLDSVDVCFNVTARFHQPLNCCTSVRIPPAEQGGFTVDCTLEPDTVFVQEGTGEYEEATFTTRLTNPTNTVVDSVRCSIILPNGVLLAGGETKVKVVRDLQPSAVESVQWRLTFVRDTATVYSDRTITIEMIGAGAFQQCAQSIVVAPPPVLPSDFVLNCSTRDTIVYNAQAMQYDPAPFLITAEIRNTGSTQLTGIRGTITPAAEIALEPGENLTKPLGVDLDPGQSAVISWNCRGIPQSGTTTAQSQISVEADGSLVRQCQVETVLYHPPSNDSGDAEIMCIAPDSLRYDPVSGTWAPSPYTMTVQITNTGIVPLTSVRAVLLVQCPFIKPVSGDPGEKTLSSPLLPGHTATLGWQLELSSVFQTESCRHTVVVTSPEIGQRTCEALTVVEGPRSLIQLQIPDDNVGVMGETVKVPVILTNPQNLTLRDMTIAVHADPELVSIDHVTLEGTVLENWPQPVVDQPAAGVTRVHVSSDQFASASGPMVYLHCRLLQQNGRDGSFGVLSVPLTFVPEYHAYQQGVVADLIDGMITSSGVCVEPLVSDAYIQLSNRPNPFNPMTTIRYHVPQDLDGLHGVLEVLDAHGRLVRTLVEDRLKSGTHDIVFDGNGLATGMYLYRLRAGNRMVTRKMMLSK